MHISSITDFYYWEWQDERNNWNPYNAKTSVSLEKAKEAGQKNMSFEAYNRSYTVNVAKMEQVNDATGVIRKVQRVQSSEYFYLFRINSM